MRLENSLGCVAELSPDELASFRADLDPQWIEAALQATGTATLRKRRLPAEQVVWLVIGMALFRNKAITEVASSLDIALPTPTGEPTAARSAVSEARGRLGEEPLAWLFGRCAKEWAHASADRQRWRGLALYAVDGTTMRVPDTDENREHFGLASGKRGNSGYPLMRLVAVTAVRSHLLAKVEFGPYTNGEYTYAAKVWHTMPDHSLTLIDKNFLSAALLLSFPE
ncbi:MAG: IS4 family transposase, partial [Deltaproteobacteria bacterium]|nr:IS4 family transposase [Deltaproteobacteria bacterium]